MKLCKPCAERNCEARGPDCDDSNVCQCPCALAESPEDLAAFARELRTVSGPFEEVSHA